MSTTTFDTLGYFDKLKAAGFSEQQAKVQTEALREIIEDKLATKQDLKEMEMRMEMRFQETDVRLKELEYRLTIRMGSMLAAAVAVLAALVVLVK